MRYHWGLGVGHLYSHSERRAQAASANSETPPTAVYRNEPESPVVDDGNDQHPQAAPPQPLATSHPKGPSDQQEMEEDDLDIVREAEEELDVALEQNRPQFGELPGFILEDDDDEAFNEDADDGYQQAMFSGTDK
jgi:hypothetical protein